MELEIVQSAGVPTDSILSLSNGATRRQMKVVPTGRMRLPAQSSLDGNSIKVDIFARVGTQRLLLERGEDLYDLAFDGDMSLKLRILQAEQEGGSARQKLQNAQAADSYIEQHDLHSFASGAHRTDDVMYPSDATDMPASPTSAQLSQEDIDKHNLTVFAKDYIERHKLRQFLQDMFQNVIREKPDDPYVFMQDHLEHLQPPADQASPGSSGGQFRKGRYAPKGSSPSASRAPGLPDDEKPKLQLQEDSTGNLTFTIGIPAPPGEARTGMNPAAEAQPAQVAVTGHGYGTAAPSAQEIQDDAAVVNTLTGKVTLRQKPDAVRDADVEELGPPPKNPQYLVDLVGCQDKFSNGTFAWVGEYQSHPLYRLLGPDPRYLYYWDDPRDKTWGGWWIAEATGSNDYIEWFRTPSAALPTNCGAGELGGRVVEAPLTQQTVEMIGTVANKYEETTIRGKLAEGFGKEYNQLEKGFRNRSLNSATASVARAFESQQRALEVLQEKLAEEMQRREIAEQRAREMEEAFQTLQQRVSAFIPS